MGPWLLSIAGVVILGVIVELVMSDGPMSKFIRGIYAFFILLVIVSPLPNLLSNGIEVGGGIQIDEELLHRISDMNVGATEVRARQTLHRAGIESHVVVTRDRGRSDFVIETVRVSATQIDNITNEELQRRVISIITVALQTTADKITVTVV